MSAAEAPMTDTGTIRRNEPMARHTSWRVGGPADVYFVPRDAAELGRFLAALPGDTPVTFVGLGSNLLVRDGGVRGVVVAMTKIGPAVTRLDATRVRAGAGVACTRLAKRCVAWQLGPAAFFAGIPGTVGGALAMNAGAYGGETWDRVESVETIDRAGQVRVRAATEFGIGYRSVRGAPGEWFVSATWALAPDAETDRAAIRSMVERRSETQPIGPPTAGSVFRNPEGGYAGDLIERAGLKGFRVGGAAVSDKHANFIVNHGTATAADIEALIEHVRASVHARFGVALEPEVRIVGDAAEES